MQLAGSSAERWSDPLNTARPWRPDAQRALVVVPHPDDEAVMFGGLIAYAARRGVAVEVLAVTDGEAAYPQRLRAEHLATLRRFEQSAAVEELGLAPDHIVRLGLPDGGVASQEHDLTAAIAERLTRGGIDLLVAPWSHDHHCDHEACGRASQTAVEQSGLRLSVAFGLFWSILRDDPPSTIELRALPLTTWEMRRKRSAIKRHVSQVTPLIDDPPVLVADDLAITRWSREHYIVAEP